MLDEFKDEDLTKKVGGRFRLTTLIQKRIVALNRGARPLVDLPTNDMMEVVVQEILQDKIFLDESGEAAVVAAEEAAPNVLDMMGDAGPVNDAGPDLEDL